MCRLYLRVWTRLSQTGPKHVHKHCLLPAVLNFPASHATRLVCKVTVTRMISMLVLLKFVHSTRTKMKYLYSDLQTPLLGCRCTFLPDTLSAFRDTMCSQNASNRQIYIQAQESVPLQDEAPGTALYLPGEQPSSNARCCNR